MREGSVTREVLWAIVQALAMAVVVWVPAAAVAGAAGENASILMRMVEGSSPIFIVPAVAVRLPSLWARRPGTGAARRAGAALTIRESLDGSALVSCVALLGTAALGLFEHLGISVGLLLNVYVFLWLFGASVVTNVLVSGAEPGAASRRGPLGPKDPR